MMNRYGREKSPLEFSVYGGGVVSVSLPGPADKYKWARTEIDCRTVTPTGLPTETQIGVKVTEQHARCTRAMHGHLVLRPEDAETLALRLAPHLGRGLEALERIAVAEDLHEALAVAGEALRAIERDRKGE